MEWASSQMTVGMTVRGREWEVWRYGNGLGVQDDNWALAEWNRCIIG